jgi:hypothetical protein
MDRSLLNGIIADLKNLFIPKKQKYIPVKVQAVNNNRRNFPNLKK